MSEDHEIFKLELNLKYPAIPVTHNPSLELTDENRIDLLVASVDHVKYVIREICKAKPELVRLGPVELLKIAVTVFEQSFEDFHKAQEEGRKGFGA